MSKLIKSQWARLAFGKGNSSLNESSQQSDEFQATVLDLLTNSTPKQASNAAWQLTMHDYSFKDLLVQMHLATIDFYTENGRKKEAVAFAVPGTEEQGVRNENTGLPVGIGRKEWYLTHPEVALEFLQRAATDNPRAYKRLQSQFMRSL